MKPSVLSVFALAAVAVSAVAFADELPRNEIPPIKVNTLYTGTLTKADLPTDSGGSVQRFFKVSLRAGDVVMIEAKSTSVDPTLALYGPDMAQIAQNDDAASGNTDAMIAAEISAGGDHVVRLGTVTDAVGEVTLRVSRMRRE